MKERLKLLKQAIKPLITLIVCIALVSLLFLLENVLEDIIPFFDTIGALILVITAIIGLASFLFIFLYILQFLIGDKYDTSFYLLAFLVYIITVAGLTLPYPFIMNDDIPVPLIISNLLLGLLTTYLYFLPYIIAVKKTHHQATAIYILNLLAGWTIIAWIIALIWANTAPKEKIVIEQKSESNADELKKYKELLDGGIITQEEFDAKKKQLLGL